MNEIQPIEFTIDTTSVEQGVKRSNKAIDDFGTRTIRTSLDVETAWERQARQMERLSRGVESYGTSFERSMRGLAAGVRGTVEFGLAVATSTKLVLAHVTAQDALAASMNRLRAARVGVAAFTEGLGGAAVVGTEIAAVVAIEKIAAATYARSKEIQSQALAAQRTGFSYEDRSALDFTAQRAGRPVDYYDSAVKSAGGVAQLSKELRDLADVRDPLVRAELAFKEFGPAAETVLASLGDRFGDNIQRAQEWGVALDQVSRGRIDGFRRDVDGIRGTFDSLGDSIAQTKKQLGALLEVDLSSIWEIMTRGPGALWSKIKPPIAFSVDPLDTKGAQRDIQQRSSTNSIALAQQQMLASFTAPAEKRFQKDQNSVDNEASLRADIADLQKKLFVSDRTSENYGKLVTGASYPGGPGQEALAVQKYTSEQNQLARVLQAKKDQADADAAARKAAEELAAAQRTVASGLQSAQLAELTGMDRLRKERDNQIRQYAKTLDLVNDIDAAFDIRFGIEGKAIIAQSARDMQTRAAVEARSQESQLDARSKYTSDAIMGAIRISGEAPQKRDNVARQGADLDRESQLRQLESADAKTLQQKEVVEARKLSIETNYFNRVQDLEAAGINRGYWQQLDELRVLLDSKLIAQNAYNQQADALYRNQQLDLLKLAKATQAEIEKAGIASAKAVREEYSRELSVIQGEASHLLDTLFTDPAHFGKQLSDTIRAAFLKPVISGLSNDIAKSLQPAIYGQGNNTNAGGGGFSFSKMADAMGIRQSPQQDWILGDATKQGVLAGYSKFSGTPVYNKLGKKNGPLGDFGEGTINMYARSMKDAYSANELPWGAARTFIHEDTHAVLDSKDIKALNGMLPPDFVKQSIQGLVKSNHYSDADAQREIIPRLVTSESTGASGFDDSKIFRDFITTLKPQDAKLADTLSRMGQTTGAYPRVLPNGAPDNSDAPAINDLLRSTQPLNDYRISGSTVGGGFSFPTSGPSSSDLGVPAGIGGMASPYSGNSGFSFPTGSGGGSSSGFVPTGVAGLRALMGGGTSSPYQQSQVPGGQMITGGVKETLANLKQVDWGHFNHSPITGTPGPDADTPGTDDGGGGISGVGGMAGAAMQMGGMYLAQRGLLGQDRGTGKGILEGAGGGAIVGFQMGGPIGAAAGAAIGAGIGLGEMLAGVESPENKAIRLVKDLYRIDINIQMARQIVQLANSKYATNINLAIRDPQVRQMMGLFAAGTGQGSKFPLSASTPTGASLIEQGGQLYQGQTYQYGVGRVMQSSLPVAGGGNAQVYPTVPSLQLDGPATTALLRGEVVQIATPGFIQNGFAQSQLASNGRVANSAMIQQPGLIVG